MRPIHIAMILAIDLLWALNTVALKESVELMPPLLAVALRYAMVLVVCLPWMRVAPGRMALLLGTGLVAGALSFACGGLAFAVADNVAALALAGQLGVPFSLLLAVLLFGERIRWVRGAGIALAFAGVALLAFDPGIADERLGLWLSVAGALFWALGNLGFRRLKGIHVLNIYGWVSLVSVPALAAASLMFEPASIARAAAAPVAAWGWIAFSALGATLVGHVGMAWLLQRYPVTVITPLTLPTPLLSVLVAQVAYPQKLSVLEVAGGLLTLAGVAIIAWRTALRGGEAARDVAARGEGG